MRFSAKASATAFLVAAAAAPALIPASVFAQDPAPAFRGIVRAASETMISSDLGVRILDLPLREGQGFSKGDVLAVFDCRGLEAQMHGAQALLRAEQLTHANTVRLAKARAAGAFEVELSRAKADQAAAEVEAFESKIERCTIRAPYDGHIALMRAHAYETPELNQPILQIVRDGDLEIETLLPSVWLRWLKPGTRFEVSIDETGTSFPAEVTRMAAVVDPVSQTIKVIGRFTGEAGGVLPGMSGPATFPSMPDK
ncbi:efflux RND transporter periplasmic adaptor subunit [Pararhizobium sp.]|uniref:efflux RND transporter periplasmic adaptor subunit n=1 Tax=Pararhizobium sp. TaxID=1977563 RepID=UPI00271DF77E|nr:HlyD family efflux transporter periplasmic adaptor subunit [Pararhizobium sp.]MDO9417173.1 HlyD family efflux transporter periplasmic adaptor subunit [Pararhizobium sp.]